MVLGYSSSYFLGEEWSKTPLYSEKIVPLLDYVLSSNYEYSDKLSSSYFELINKYQNTTDMPVDSIREVIKENGYDYLLDLLNPEDDRLNILVYLLPLIHQYKGTPEGVKVVLSLFQLSSDSQETVITQWYNKTPVGTENTFSLQSDLDVSGAGDNFFLNFGTFIKSYVYPELEELKVKYLVKSETTQIPYITQYIDFTSQYDID